MADDNIKLIDGVPFSWKTYLPIILVAGLGFLVDVYDVLLFAILRVPSLKDLGVSPADTLEVGVGLLNAQMVGLILGGIVWGAIGDRKGRKAALVGSILCYSIASILNSFITDVSMYGVLRFVTGFGLAGEVGAAMTIAAEVTPARYRTYGTAAVSLMGVLGSVLASIVGSAIQWRTAYFIAGVAGLALLCIRIKMNETALFEKAKSEGGLSRDGLMKLARPKKLLKVLRCVLVALPLFFVFGVLVTFAPEIMPNGAEASYLVAKIAAFYSIGEALGEAVCGVTSQLLRSRKKAILLFQVCALVLTIFTVRSTPDVYAFLCLPLGFFVGYWAIAITTTAEQFGTNVRSTVTTVVPNLMRACHIPINLTFAALVKTYGTNTAVISLGICSYVLAFISLFLMEETFARDLDFLES
ncbi:MFS transporter [Candidatus Obscuribacterales bacterium]|nr:MFS transporter [Candidatus Obscuribacterales bacterium]MBX3149885.1 MFS transporter [Candidatus Obscuribacterales bacterium]